MSDVSVHHWPGGRRRTSLAREVADGIVEQIAAGRWAPGDQLPPEPVLAEQLDRLVPVGQRIRRLRFACSTAEITDDGRIRLNGWALHAVPLARISVRAGERRLGDATFPTARADIARQFPEYGTEKAGFAFESVLPPDLRGIEKATLEFHAKDGPVGAEEVNLARAPK